MFRALLCPSSGAHIELLIYYLKKLTTHTHTQGNTTITTHKGTLLSPHITEHYDHHSQGNTTITTHNRTLRSPHKGNTTITTHNRTLRSPHTREH